MNLRTVLQKRYSNLFIFCILFLHIADVHCVTVKIKSFSCLWVVFLYIFLTHVQQM